MQSTQFNTGASAGATAYNPQVATPYTGPPVAGATPYVAPSGPEYNASKPTV